MPKIDELIGKMNKSYGPGTAGRGLVLPQMKRLPSGIFDLDLKTGGGIPRNKLTILFGNYSAGKSNLALCFVREHQRRFKDKSCVFMDIEGTLVTDWAKKFGVDTEELVVMRPSYAEQTVDIAYEVLAAEDCGLLVIDSIAALASMSELDKSAEEAVIASTAKPVTRMVRKLTTVLNEAAKGEDPDSVPTILWINQQRVVIGGNTKYVTYTFPGGEAQRFMAAMIIRLHGKDIMDPEVHEHIPARKEVTGTIQRWKTPIFDTSFTYEQAMIPHMNTPVGRCPDDWSSVKKYLETFELMEKVGDGSVLYGGETFKTQKALWMFLQEEDHMAELQHKLLETALKEPINTDPKTIALGVK